MIIQKSQYKRATWKNGLGHTDEIAIFPPGSSLLKGDFLWRLSSAQIENSSPFSLFPAHDRVLVVLKGAGLRMIHTFEVGDPEDSTEVPPFEPYEFPGDVKSRCELLNGSITDFSLFMRTGEVGGRVVIQEMGADQDFLWNPEGKWNFAHAIQGSFDTGVGNLQESDTLSVTRVEVQFRTHSRPGQLLLIELESLI